MIKEFTSQTEETMGINVCFLEAPCSATREEIQTAVEEYIDEQNNKRAKERIFRNFFEARQIEFFDEEYRSCREKSFTNYVGSFDDERDAFWSQFNAKDCLILNMRFDYRHVVNDRKELGYYAIRFKDLHNTVFSEEYNNLAKEIDEKKAYFTEQEKQRKIECQHCGSLINASYIKKSCPVCRTPMNVKHLGDEEIKELESRLSKMRESEMDSNAPLKWLIAIWVKSGRY